MPYYDIRNKETDEVTEKFMTIAQLEVFLKDNPQFEVVILQSRIGDPYHLGVQKVPSDFVRYIVEPIQRHAKKAGYNKEVRATRPREI